MSQTITSHHTMSTSLPTERIRRVQRPIVDTANDVILVHQKAKRSAIWCLVNTMGALLAYFGIVQFCIVQLIATRHPLFSYIDTLLFMVFCWNVLTNVYLYCLPVFRKQKIALSQKQKQLLGINRENEYLFQSSPTVTQAACVKPQSTTTTTPTQASSYPIRRTATRTSPASPFDVSPGRQHSPNRSQTSPINKYSPSRNTTPVYNSTMQRNLSRDSFHTQSYSSNSPLNISRGLSMSGSPSSSFKQSPSWNGRKISPSRVNSQDEQLLSFTSLDKYIKQEEEQEARLQRGQDSPQKHSIWKYGIPAYEYIPSFGSYQLATRSQTPNLKDDDDNGAESPFKHDEILRNLGLTRGDVSIWTENIRKWLAQTVLEPLVKEIDDINKKLTHIGNPELHIGLAATSSLQQVIATKGQYFPSLTTIIPYLNAFTNQEYFVGRLKELATGGCLRLYKWESGGQYKGKPWNNDLPSDPEILIHLFCTYMDTHLPSNPRYPDGKSFSGMHFLKSPQKSEERRSDLCIYQTRTKKAHFKVLVDKEVCELPKGRNNLFYAIVVFLYYAKQVHHGMLQRVNLGLSGINILWVLNKN